MAMMIYGDDIRRGLFTTPDRRRLILGGAALAAAGGLGASRLLGAPDAQAASGAPREGGELVVAIDGAAVSKFVLDPHNSAFAPHNRMVRSIYDSLTLLLPDQTIGPWLAESWEISADRTVYDFKLRQGVHFHDGTPFDAHAVKANFDRLGDPQSTLVSRRNLGPYHSSEVLADDVVRLRLERPYTPLLRHLSMTRLAMVSPTAVAKYGKTYGQHPVGTGPFRFVGLHPGAEVRLERNPDYQWAPSTALHAGPARLERLTFKNVPEQATRLAVLLSGQAHAADLIPPQDLEAVRRNSAFEVHEKELLNTNYALTLNTDNAPWGEEEARLAFRLSLDLDTIVKVIYRGALKRAWSPLSPSLFGSAEDELAGSWSYDPERADAIFERLGWLRGRDGMRAKDGQRLSISFMESQGNREKRLDVVQLIRRQLAERGVDLKMANQPPGSQAEMIRANKYEMTGGAQFAPDPDVLRGYFSPHFRNAMAANKTDDPELTAWLDAAAEEADDASRAALYRKAQRRIVEKTYAVPIYVLLYNLAASRRVSGLTIDTHGFPEFHGAWLNA